MSGPAPDADHSDYYALRVDLGDLLAADPDGAAAREWFGCTYQTATGVQSGYVLLRPVDYVRILDADPLPRIDQAWLASSGILVPFNLTPGDDDGRCIGATSFGLMQEPPTQQDLGGRMASAVPLLVHTMRLYDRAMTARRAAILSGEAPNPFLDLDRPVDMDALRAAVLYSVHMTGLNATIRNAEFLFPDLATGIFAPEETVLEVIASPTQEELVMIVAARPFADDILRMFEDDVRNPAEVICGA